MFTQPNKMGAEARSTDKAAIEFQLREWASLLDD
jgi:hypothetical protein